jgi:proteasome lid subunit RPN8/RPN11
MAVELSSDVLEAMLDQAERATPLECCGILLGHGHSVTAVTPAANVHPAPRTNFEIDPQSLLDANRVAREGGAQVVGYYHSHPNGRAEPSVTDRARAVGDGRIWAIVAAGDVTFWRDGEGGFTPLSYTVFDG